MSYDVFYMKRRKNNFWKKLDRRQPHWFLFINQQLFYSRQNKIFSIKFICDSSGFVHYSNGNTSYHSGLHDKDSINSYKCNIYFLYRMNSWINVICLFSDAQECQTAEESHPPRTSRGRLPQRLRRQIMRAIRHLPRFTLISLHPHLPLCNSNLYHF